MSGSEHNNTSGTSSCSYTDGAKYVGCQVAERGLPQPQYMTGGRKRTRKNKTMKHFGKSKKCHKCHRKTCKCKKCHKCHRKTCKCKKTRGRKGGFLQNAIVPFGLLALHKRTQRRHKHSHGRKHKSK
jgi:hypothetical protein